MKRSEVIRNAKTNIANNQKAIDGIHELYERKDISQLIKLTREDPDSKEAKKLYRKIEPLLCIVGGNVMYGALESSRMQTTVCEMARRYNNGFCFLTLSLDDLSNIRSIRAAMKTTRNNEFPAVFGGVDGVFEDSSSFMRQILIDSSTVANASLNLSGENLRYQKSNLARLAIENPIAFVMETKSMITHILSILFGLPPEHFFGVYESNSYRKTPLYNTRRKSIMGSIFSYVGAVEDHMKGTLHFHIILFGSISPYVLQELCPL